MCWWGRKPSSLLSCIVNGSFSIEGHLATTNIWFLEDFSSKHKHEAPGTPQRAAASFRTKLGLSHQKSMEVHRKGVLVSAWLLLEASWSPPLCWPYQFLLTLNHPHVHITESHCFMTYVDHIRRLRSSWRSEVMKASPEIILKVPLDFCFNFAIADKHGYPVVLKDAWYGKHRENSVGSNKADILGLFQIEIVESTTESFCIHPHGIFS